ncbi:hypothetical protein F5884DRAFT_861523 [Xylogone sp. PMI_703]|nr:hypothetical protein F5884DRAFT_861523 [Xylogone sp. PMI_703]
MSSTANSDSRDLEALKFTLSTATALIAQLQSGISENNRGNAPQSASQGTLSALNLAHDAASLIRAHSTKLSLLIINEPFTPTAITKVLRELLASPLPGLASAIELCAPEKYTKAMSEELKWRGKKVFSEIDSLVKQIPVDGKILKGSQKNGGGLSGKGSLATTGAVWEACDAVMELKSIGVGGLFVKRAEQYRDLIKDAMEELQEWGEEADESDADANYSDDEQEADHDSAQAAVDALLGSQAHIPAEDPNKIRPRLETSLRRLKLMTLLYQAVVKRRFKTLPLLPLKEPAEDSKTTKKSLDAEYLDRVLGIMKKIPDNTDELANAFYELDASAIDACMDECFLSGFLLSELLSDNWEGKKDEFSKWASNFQDAIKANK